MRWLMTVPVLLLGMHVGIAQDEQSVLSDPLKPGLAAKYWPIGKEMKKFPEDLLSQGTPICRVDGMINFDAKEGRVFKDLPWTEYFAVVWTGFVRLPKDSSYTFYVKSGDGSKLFLDGKLIVDHDGTHPIKETASKTVTMTAGDHEVRVEYFQNKEGRCILFWKYEGVDKQVVPSTAFWHTPDKEFDRESR